MPQTIQEDKKYGKEIVDWNIPEYYKHKRGAGWYIMAGIIDLVLIFYAFSTDNFLFAVIVIIASFIIILFDSNDPEEINFRITTIGIIIGNKFYDYDEIKNFSIIYKPNEEIKKLYFEFKNVITQRLFIPLEDQNPLQVRNILLKYLSEDLDRDGEPLSEAFSRTFKI